MVSITYSQSKTGFVVLATHQLDIGNGIRPISGFPETNQSTVYKYKYAQQLADKKAEMSQS